ncbi:MAG: VOC family protein [Thermomicrobiales bacterium]|nr:VOC family protein [Thermomicrobiales bacterium]
MRPHISVLTIGVEDLERSLLFYRDGLGLPASDIQGDDLEFGAVVFIELQSGLALALWPRTSIAHDSGMPLSGASPTDFTIGHNVGSPNEVDAVMSQAERAGATVVKQPKETFWGGYAGYFQDLDGHLWEIVWNPDGLPPDDAT